MKISPHFVRLLAALPVILFTATLSAFEGRITVQTTQGGRATPLLYTVGTNFLRVEIPDPSRPNPVNILDRHSGVLTMVFPHNRSFVRVKALSKNPGMDLPPPPEKLAAPPMSQSPAAPNIPATASPPPTLPAMPKMSPPLEAIELKATGEKTNLFGWACARYEIKQRGEIMEVWATDQLPPFQNYRRNLPPHIPLRMLEERWSELLTANKLFPVRAILRFEKGAERYRFEVQSSTPQKLPDEDLKLFQPPAGYVETQPLPF